MFACSTDADHDTDGVNDRTAVPHPRLSKHWWNAVQNEADQDDALEVISRAAETGGGAVLFQYGLAKKSRALRVFPLLQLKKGLMLPWLLILMPPSAQRLIRLTPRPDIRHCVLILCAMRLRFGLSILSILLLTNNLPMCSLRRLLRRCYYYFAPS